MWTPCCDNREREGGREIAKEKEREERDVNTGSRVVILTCLVCSKRDRFTFSTTAPYVTHCYQCNGVCSVCSQHLIINFPNNNTETRGFD